MWAKKNIISGRSVSPPFLWCDIMCCFHAVATSVTSSRNNSMKQNLRQSTWTGSVGSNNSRSSKFWRKCFHQPGRSLLKFHQEASILWFIGDKTIVCYRVRRFIRRRNFQPNNSLWISVDPPLNTEPAGFDFIKFIDVPNVIWS